ncbi:MAG: polysaccharide deacetylase family protein [Desulfuromonadales bacterium]
MSLQALPLRISALFLHVLTIFLFLQAGCATVSVPDSPPPVILTPAQEEPRPAPPQQTGREHRSEDYVVIHADASDTYEFLAKTYLGDEKLAYLISEFNDSVPIVSGKDVVIPIKPVNPGGLYSDGYQTVPVLCYHQFSLKKSKNKISVTMETFDRQMAYLKNNGYTVITLKQFDDFIEYRQRPPKKSVLISIDDGWKTVRTIAYPILKKYGFTAVLFVYTDLIKSKPNSVALSWDDVREMVASGVIEVESHTVTHADLTKVGNDQVRKELADSQSAIHSKLGVTSAFLAYPYGNFNHDVVDGMRKSGYKAGFTVIRGENAFFSNTWSLNRSMVFNSEKIEDFIKLLETFRRE